MTYPSPNIPQITLPPGIFTPRGVLAAIEDPDQTARKAQPRCKESGRIPSDLGSWMYHPWNPMVKNIWKIRLNVTILKICRKNDGSYDFFDLFCWCQVIRSQTYNKKVASFWISCDGPCGPSHTRKRPRFGSKQCTWLRRLSLKVFRKQDIFQLQHAHRKKWQLSLFFFSPQIFIKMFIPYLSREIDMSCIYRKISWHILRRGLGNVANLWQGMPWEAETQISEKIGGDVDIFQYLSRFFFPNFFWIFMRVFCVTQCVFV